MFQVCIINSGVYQSESLLTFKVVVDWQWLSNAECKWDQEWLVSGYLGEDCRDFQSAVVAFIWERLREVTAWTQSNRYTGGIRTHHLWSTNAERLLLQGAGCNPLPLCSECFVFADTVAQGRDLLSRSCLCFNWRERKKVFYIQRRQNFDEESLLKPATCRTKTVSEEFKMRDQILLSDLRPALDCGRRGLEYKPVN